MEFLVNCEKEMKQIGNNINDAMKINFVTRHFKDSAAQWYTIIRDNITTYQQFCDSFEIMYSDIHTQRQLRDQLEYRNFNVHGRQSIEQYTIAHIERVKHLKPCLLYTSRCV